MLYVFDAEKNLISIFDLMFLDKSGCKEEDMVNLVKNILENCPNLEFIGLMTIGSFDHDLSKGPNPDFLVILFNLLVLCCILLPFQICKNSSWEWYHIEMYCPFSEYFFQKP